MVLASALMLLMRIMAAFALVVFAVFAAAITAFEGTFGTGPVKSVAIGGFFIGEYQLQASRAQVDAAHQSEQLHTQRTALSLQCRFAIETGPLALFC